MWLGIWILWKNINLGISQTFVASYVNEWCSFRYQSLNSHCFIYHWKWFSDFSGAEITYHSGTSEIIPCIMCGFCFSIFRFLCSVIRSLFGLFFAIMLSILLLFTFSDWPLVIFKLEVSGAGWFVHALWSFHSLLFHTILRHVIFIELHVFVASPWVHGNITTCTKLRYHEIMQCDYIILS